MLHVFQFLFLSTLLPLFLKMVSYVWAGHRTCHVPKASLQLLILLPPPTKSSEYRPAQTACVRLPLSLPFSQLEAYGLSGFCLTYNTPPFTSVA